MNRSCRIVMLSVVALGGVIAVAVSATRYEWIREFEVPPAGSLCIGYAPERTGFSRYHFNPRGEATRFEVAYQGPKPVAEIVIENWDGPTLTSTKVVMHRKFGCRSVRKEGDTIHVGDGDAFLQDRQRYSVWIYELPEPFPDGRNALIRIGITQPDRDDLVGESLANELASIDALTGRGFGQESGARSTEVTSDTESHVVWEKIEYANRGESLSGPPYAAGVIVSRMLYRVVAE